MSSKFSELVLDSLFSNEATGTYVDNNLSNRPPTNIVGMALHSARIPLTFDTVFYPNNYIKWTIIQQAPTISGLLTSVYVGRDRDNNGILYTYPQFDTTPGSTQNSTAYNVFPSGTPGTTMGNQIAYFAPPNNLTLRWTNLGNQYSWQGVNIPMFLSPLFVVPQSGFSPVNTVVYNAIYAMYSELSYVGSQLQLVVRMISQNNLFIDGMVIQLNYSQYIGRRLGLPTSGTWTITLSGGDAVSTSVPAVQDIPGTYPNVNIKTWRFTFPYSVDVGINRSLILRGNLANEMQNQIYSNDQNQSGADVVAVVPVQGNSGDTLIWETPTQQVFSLPRPITISYVRLYFTRGEDPLNTPVNFNGFDYWLKFAMETANDSGTIDYSDNGSFVTSAIQTFKS